MSKSTNSAQGTVIDNDDDLQPQEMSARKRIVLIGVAIFCLLVFSVTGPMFYAFDTLFGGGPPVIATAELPSGSIELTEEDRQRADRLIRLEQRFYPQFQRSTEEDDVLVYALMRRLADEMNITVTDADLANTLIAMKGSAPYQDLYRGMGFSSAVEFEMALADVMRVPMLEGMIQQAAMIPTDRDVVELFTDRYKQFQAEYVVLRASDFEAAALALEPTDEELQTFYDEGLTFQQQNELENEDGVAFEALVLSADALETEAVQAWASQEEPTEEQLSAFYDFNKRFLYELELPTDGEIDPDLSPFISRDELGDRLARDFKIQRAIGSLIAEAAESEDLQAFADEKGLELMTFEEVVPRSQLESVERIGSPQLTQLLRQETGTFMSQAILGDGYGMLARPTEQRARELPQLEEIRESVIDYWRESRMPELARDAADALIAEFPQPEVEGDPVIVDADTFSTAVAAADFNSQTLGWISRTRRPGVDPVWDAEDEVSDWLRGQVGRSLDDFSDGEVLGPFEHTFVDDPFVVVGRLVGTRDPDPTQIWPSELESLRRGVGFQLQQTFRADQLSFEAMARNYQLERVNVSVDA